jgi:hypothetical protein
MELITIPSNELQSILELYQIHPKVYNHIVESSSIKTLDIKSEEVMLFTQRYLLYRRRLNHKGLDLIVPGNINWKTAVEIVDYIQRVFCVEHQIEYGKESLNKFFGVIKALKYVRLKQIHFNLERITEYSDMMIAVQDDPDPTSTQEFLDLYFEEGFSTKGNRSFDIHDLELRYNIIKLLDYLIRSKVPFKTFISEYFDYWSFTGGWPRPSLLLHTNTIELITKIRTDLNLGTPTKAQGIYVKVIARDKTGD